MFLKPQQSSNQTVSYHTPKGKTIKLTIKREDLLHPDISGNKYRKLFYNIDKAHQLGYSKLITFGGAFSNHIAATAAAANEFGFECIGIIRGDELQHQPDKVSNNPTLSFALKKGMQLEFVTRTEYRQKHTENFLKQLKDKYGSVYIVPEGGTNTLAVKGCQEILTETDNQFDLICCAIGTGGTISGIINSSQTYQQVMGFPALKGSFLDNEIKKYTFGKANWCLNYNYNFGSFAKVNNTLVRFINDFKHQTSISLDPIYTGKMLFGIVDLIDKELISTQQNILAIHTGGLQGIAGMNIRLQSKHQTLLDI